MVFTIVGAVGLVTGGVSGIGLCYSKELLRNGAKGVTLADVNQKLGEQALEEIKKEFGDNRAIFVKTDVTNISDFRRAFQNTVDKFDRVDILINNAGILNDAIWEKEVAINFTGVIHGMLLGIENFFPKFKSPNQEALIINISSIAGIIESPHVPIYSGTKYAVIGLTRGWGSPPLYKKTNTRVVAVCPGVTITPLITEMTGRSLGEKYEEFSDDVKNWPTQEPYQIAKEVMNVIRYAPTGTTWVIEGGEPAYEYVHPEKESMKGKYLNKL